MFASYSASAMIGMRCQTMEEGRGKRDITTKTRQLYQLHTISTNASPISSLPRSSDFFLVSQSYFDHLLFNHGIPTLNMDTPKLDFDVLSLGHESLCRTGLPHQSRRKWTQDSRAQCDVSTLQSQDQCSRIRRDFWPASLHHAGNQDH